MSSERVRKSGNVDVVRKDIFDNELFITLQCGECSGVNRTSIFDGSRPKRDQDFFCSVKWFNVTRGYTIPPHTVNVSAADDRLPVMGTN